jgi:tripartite-type tricarboxylate transporter receptor subunit TctC
MPSSQLSRTLSSVTLAAAITAATLPSAAHAQDYPSKNITIVVPLVAGTGMDAIARAYAESLSKALGKAVLVENQPGATLTLAAQNVAKATPDGHTLLVSATLQMSAPQVLVKKVNYDPDKDFVPISIYLTSPFVLIVNPSSGVNTLRDLIDRAKASAATPLTYATSGTGSFPHLVMEVMKRDHSFPANHVPYRNSGQIISDVLGGHVAASMSETGAALGLIKDGKLKALAITSAARIPSMPDVPTVAEAVNQPAYEAVSWHILAAPAATPKPVVDRLVAEMATITADPEFRKRVSTAGLIPRQPMSATEMQTYVKSERVRWSGWAKTLGIEPQQ